MILPRKVLEAALEGGEVPKTCLNLLVDLGDQLGVGLCVEEVNEALIGLGERPVGLQEEG